MKPSSESLTPIHCDFLQVCLISKCYSIAQPILDEEIFDVNPEATAVTSRDMLLYYYYGGLIYTGLKDYKKALAFFRQVILTKIFSQSLENRLLPHQQLCLVQ
jgi:COP9 signalosome complex subunit 3